MVLFFLVWLGCHKPQKLSCLIQHYVHYVGHLAWTATSINYKSIFLVVMLRLGLVLVLILFLALYLVLVKTIVLVQVQVLIMAKTLIPTLILVLVLLLSLSWFFSWSWFLFWPRSWCWSTSLKWHDWAQRVKSLLQSLLMVKISCWVIKNEHSRKNIDQYWTRN